MKLTSERILKIFESLTLHESSNIPWSEVIAVQNLALVGLMATQVSGASPVAEVQGEQPSQPLPNASPTPGPGKVCGECGGDRMIRGFDTMSAGETIPYSKPCPRCKGSGLEGEK